jgi:UDP-N-acetylglucosamine acyltransferase
MNNCTVHPTAIIADSVRIADGCQIGPYVVIEDDAVLGDHCVVGPHVCIGRRTVLGDRVEVYHGASLGLPPQARKGGSGLGGLRVGSDTIVREHVTLNAVASENGWTTIGERCLLMAYVHVGHGAQVGDDVILVNGATLGGFVEIEHHATISAMVPVHQYSLVGAYSYVGGGYRVVKDVPPYVMAAGDPLKPHGLNAVGLRRNGFTLEQMTDLRDMYRLFYRSGLNTSQALDRFDELAPSPERDHFAGFVRRSKRGIIR